jgi:hypothetical protein
MNLDAIFLPAAIASQSDFTLESVCFIQQPDFEHQIGRITRRIEHKLPQRLVKVALNGGPPQVSPTAWPGRPRRRASGLPAR